MATSDKNKLTFGQLPDLSSLSQAERLQVIAVMDRAKEFESLDEKKNSNMRQPLEGLLNKYTNVMKGWQFRWFVLDPVSGALEYFEKEEHKKQRPRGCIHLAAAVVSPSDEDSQTFTVSAANGDIYRLRASDAKERQQWVDRIRSTAEFHTAHIGQSLTSENIHSLRSQHRGSFLSKPDPFKQVKEYLLEAEDYWKHLGEKISILPYSDSNKYLTALDPDLLLLKATSAATLHSLEQCLTLLKSREIKGDHSQNCLPFEHGESKENIASCVYVNFTEPRPVDTSLPSPTESFTSVTSLPYVFQDQKSEGPINHEDEMTDEEEYKDSELGEVEEHKSIILHLLSQLKLGMDLTKVVLPTFILEKRSLLELFADCMAHPDTFLRIPDLKDPEARMLAVVEWYLTSFHAGRQGSVAKKPYNPIIGETFHCSWKVPLPSDSDGTDVDNVGEPEPVELVYCAEQVSHHPPVSAFYFECPEKKVKMNASIWTKSKFMGMSIGVVMVGKVHLHLLEHDEEYVFTLPSAYARSILTVPWVELGDKISISCEKTGYNAAVVFHTKPFYGGKVHRVSAEVKNVNSGDVICKVMGEWNSSFEFTYNNNEVKNVNIHDLRIWRKRVRPIPLQGEFESRRLWQHVTNALKVGDVTTATEHKKYLEDRQREGEKHRRETNSPFPTKFFCYDGEKWVYKNFYTKTKETTS
ncbi:oxysterol-binding protein-related protein 11-like [Gigantopelta aegis]|uniref:oxysterol-binding protein-related protein 11-like n=1 Tax=Gigantopelta aegis TaxID=1735272 RepID=UPI001B88B826|nr:oxysterol-binding protein-related protein 11-like [Gigantopelta aegis]